MRPEMPMPLNAFPADLAFLAVSAAPAPSHVPGECVDFDPIASRAPKDGYPRLKPWRTDTFAIAGGRGSDGPTTVKGFCRFRPVNPCPCDTRTFGASAAASSAERVGAGLSACPTRFYGAGCGPFDRAVFVRTDGPGGAEVETDWSCVASDYVASKPTDPYRGRVTVSVSRAFKSESEARASGFASCRTQSKANGGGVLCSQTPLPGSDGLASAVSAAGPPSGLSGNYPRLTAFAGNSMKAYPVAAFLSLDATGATSRNAATLPLCKASGNPVTTSSGNIVRVRMEPSDAEVISGAVPAVKTVSAAPLAW